jgi:hypothetical protein
MAVGTYNVQKAMCEDYCVTCDGIVSSWIEEDPFAVSVDDTHQLAFHGQYNTGDVYDLTSSGSWNSSDAGVASVDVGLVTPASGGTLTAFANDNYEPSYTTGCYAYVPVCPLEYGTASQSPGTVQTPSALSITSDEYLSSHPGQNYNRERHFKVLDQYGHEMPYAGRSVTETYTPNPPSGNCTSSSITTASTATNSSGEFKDNYCMSGGPNPCTSSSTQNHSVNGHAVSTCSVTWHHDDVSINP